MIIDDKEFEGIKRFYPNIDFSKDYIEEIYKSLHVKKADCKSEIKYQNDTNVLFLKQLFLYAKDHKEIVNDLQPLLKSYFETFLSSYSEYKSLKFSTIRRTVYEKSVDDLLNTYNGEKNVMTAFFQLLKENFKKEENVNTKNINVKSIYEYFSDYNKDIIDLVLSSYDRTKNTYFFNVFHAIFGKKLDGVLDDNPTFIQKQSFQNLSSVFRKRLYVANKFANEGKQKRSILDLISKDDAALLSMYNEFNKENSPKDIKPETTKKCDSKEYINRSAIEKKFKISSEMLDVALSFIEDEDIRVYQYYYGIGRNKINEESISVILGIEEDSIPLIIARIQSKLPAAIEKAKKIKRTYKYTFSSTYDISVTKATLFSIYTNIANPILYEVYFKKYGRKYGQNFSTIKINSMIGSLVPSDVEKSTLEILDNLENLILKNDKILPMSFIDILKIEDNQVFNDFISKISIDISCVKKIYGEDLDKKNVQVTITEDECLNIINTIEKIKNEYKNYKKFFKESEEKVIVDNSLTEHFIDNFDDCNEEVIQEIIDLINSNSKYRSLKIFFELYGSDLKDTLVSGKYEMKKRAVKLKNILSNNLLNVEEINSSNIYEKRFAQTFEDNFINPNLSEDKKELLRDKLYFLLASSKSNCFNIYKKLYGSDLKHKLSYTRLTVSETRALKTFYNMINSKIESSDEFLRKNFIDNLSSFNKEDLMYFVIYIREDTSKTTSKIFFKLYGENLDQPLNLSNRENLILGLNLKSYIKEISANVKNKVLYGFRGQYAYTFINNFATPESSDEERKNIKQKLKCLDGKICLEPFKMIYGEDLEQVNNYKVLSASNKKTIKSSLHKIWNFLDSNSNEKIMSNLRERFIDNFENITEEDIKYFLIYIEQRSYDRRYQTFKKIYGEHLNENLKMDEIEDINVCIKLLTDAKELLPKVKEYVLYGRNGLMPAYFINNFLTVEDDSRKKVITEKIVDRELKNASTSTNQIIEKLYGTGGKGFNTYEKLTQLESAKLYYIVNKITDMINDVYQNTLEISENFVDNFEGVDKITIGRLKVYLMHSFEREKFTIIFKAYGEDLNSTLSILEEDKPNLIDSILQIKKLLKTINYDVKYGNQYILAESFIDNFHELDVETLDETQCIEKIKIINPQIEEILKQLYGNDLEDKLNFVNISQQQFNEVKNALNLYVNEEKRTLRNYFQDYFTYELTDDMISNFCSLINGNEKYSNYKIFFELYGNDLRQVLNTSKCVEINEIKKLIKRVRFFMKRRVANSVYGIPGLYALTLEKNFTDYYSSPEEIEKIRDIAENYILSSRSSAVPVLKRIYGEDLRQDRKVIKIDITSRGLINALFREIKTKVDYMQNDLAEYFIDNFDGVTSEQVDDFVTYINCVGYKKKIRSFFDIYGADLKQRKKETSMECKTTALEQLDEAKELLLNSTDYVNFGSKGVLPLYFINCFITKDTSDEEKEKIQKFLDQIMEHKLVGAKCLYRAWGKDLKQKCNYHIINHNDSTLIKKMIDKIKSILNGQSELISLEQKKKQGTTSKPNFRLPDYYWMAFAGKHDDIINSILKSSICIYVTENSKSVQSKEMVKIYGDNLAEKKKDYEIDEVGYKKLYYFVHNVNVYVQKYFKIKQFRQYIKENNIDINSDNIFDIYLSFIEEIDLIKENVMLKYLIHNCEYFNDKSKLFEIIRGSGAEYLIKLFEREPYSSYISSIDELDQEILVFKIKSLYEPKYTDEFISIALKCSLSRVKNISFEDINDKLNKKLFK